MLVKRSGGKKEGRKPDVYGRQGRDAKGGQTLGRDCCYLLELRETTRTGSPARAPKRGKTKKGSKHRQ